MVIFNHASGYVLVHLGDGATAGLLLVSIVACNGMMDLLFFLSLDDGLVFQIWLTPSKQKPADGLEVVHIGNEKHNYQANPSPEQPWTWHHVPHMMKNRQHQSEGMGMAGPCLFKEFSLWFKYMLEKVLLRTCISMRLKMKRVLRLLKKGSNDVVRNLTFRIPIT